MNHSFRGSAADGAWRELRGKKRHRSNIDHWLLLSLSEGSATVAKDDNECRIEAGQMVLIHPSNRGYLQENHQGGMMVGRFQVVPQGRGTGHSPFLRVPDLTPVTHPDPQRLAKVLETLHKTSERSTTMLEVFRNEVLTRELTDTCLLEGFSQGIYPLVEDDEPHWLPEVEAFIRGHYREVDLSIPDIANHFNISVRRLQQGFRQHRHTTPLELLHRTRIEFAVRFLITNPERTIGYVMGRCGYRSPSVFYRMFKRHTGLLPKDYRKG